PQMPDAKTTAETTALPLVVSGPEQRSSGESTMVLWNYDSTRSSRFAPWVPATVSFVPRDTWIIEILPRDPFYSYGKQVLIFDKESMLLFYKIVYSLEVANEKSIAVGWSLACTAELETFLPFAAFVLGVDAKGSEAMTFTTNT